MSSRVDNSVTIIGTVIKGPFPKLVAGSKIRANYQVEIASKNHDKGQTYMPFVISRGNQAQNDLENIKAGDLVVIHGRVVTRYENQMRFFVPDPDSDGRLIEKTEDEIEDDTSVMYLEDKRLVTNILAEDVYNITNMLTSMPEDKVKQMVSPKVLERVLKRIEENKNKEEVKTESDDDDGMGD